MLLMEAKKKGAVLDAKVEAFLADVECTAPYDQPLAIMTTNIFEEEHLDSDVESDIDDNTFVFLAFPSGGRFIWSFKLSLRSLKTSLVATTLASTK
nr:hypothetical protein [Tanacetum cinerariifolium]